MKFDPAHVHLRDAATLSHATEPLANPEVQVSSWLDLAVAVSGLMKLQNLLLGILIAIIFGVISLGIVIP